MVNQYLPQCSRENVKAVNWIKKTVNIIYRNGIQCQYTATWTADRVAIQFLTIRSDTLPSSVRLHGAITLSCPEFLSRIACLTAFPIFAPCAPISVN